MSDASSTVASQTGEPNSRVLLLIGSNVDADAQIKAALELLQLEFSIAAKSARYQSLAAGPVDAPSYLNQAVLISTPLDRVALKPRLRGIEARLGRERPAVDPRLCPIDIDAIACLEGSLTICDEKSFAASYAQAPIADVLDRV